MSDLPKIVLTRLKAGSAGANSPPGPQHLDANLLAAFAEKSLPEAERAQVLNHLSQCADCREVAAFIIPPEAVPEAAPRTVASRKWSPWSLLRWGALAAALGVVTIVVSLHSGGWRRNREMAVSTPPPAPAGKAAGTSQAYAPSPTALPAKPEQSYAQAEAGTSAREEEDLKNAHGSFNAPAQRKDQLQAKEESTRMAASQPPAVLRAENVPAPGLERRESLGDKATSRASVPPAVVAPVPPPPPPVGEPAAAPRVADKVTPEPERIHSTTRSATVTTETLSAQQETKQGISGLGGNVTSAQSKPGARKAAPGANERVSAQEESRGAMFGMMAARKDLKLKASPPAIAWTISPEGKVQRSSDGAKTFYSIEIAQGIKFQAVAASGNEVWAGGENGALFHSLDDGANWTQVKIVSGDGTLKETIAAIQFSDAHHLTVVTASGAQWVSEDDGLHWKGQP
jgi:hypothetical protein